MSMLRRVLDRESIVKGNLVEKLVECVKELQLKYAAENGAVLVNDEATNSLCWTLEAVFIHGLKNRFINTVSSLLSSSHDDLSPQPSFWHFVLIFCHQEDIIEIQKFSFIHTDIGRCRCWLRLSLNQGTLFSFLQMMTTEKRICKEYYKPTAFLRDTERFDILKNYLYGIESYNFQLACNSSFLNAWNYVPLNLVGLHTPPNTQYSISEGIDVAQNMDSKELQALPQLTQETQRTPPKHHKFPQNFEDHYRTPLLEEDAALRVILSSKHPVSVVPPPPLALPQRTGAPSPVTVAPKATRSSFPSPITTQRSTTPSPPVNPVSGTPPLSSTNVSDSCLRPGNSSPQQPTTMETVQSEQNLNFPQLSPVQNVQLDSSECSDGMSDNCGELSGQESRRRRCEGEVCGIVTVSRNISSPVDENEAMSYAALFETYNKDNLAESPLINSFILENEDLIKSSLARNSDDYLQENRKNAMTSSVVDQLVGYEVSSIASSSGQFSDMFSHLNTVIHVIPREMGMDSQNYRCKNCSKDIGMIYKPARLCALTGSYFCEDCHANDDYVIPSRILMNWDFNRYFVSKQAKDYLEDVIHKPLFDIEDINPQLYDAVTECAEIQMLRTQLSSISIYLRTCKSVVDEFTKNTLETEHLYEKIHVYSLADLLNIPSRGLALSLSKLVSFGRNHIVSCTFCIQKGFLCEICNDKNVIFPFDLHLIFKCYCCGAVYHKECMQVSKPCPRCRRWNKTETNADFADIVNVQ